MMVKKGIVFERSTGIIGFHDLVSVINDLVRCVSNDQRICQKIYSQIKQWILKLKRKYKFENIFQNLYMRIETPVNSNNIQEIFDPVAASTKYAPVVSTKKQKISFIEAQTLINNIDHRYKEQMMDPRDSNFNKSCGLCKRKKIHSFQM